MQNYIKTLFNALRYWIEDKFNTQEKYIDRQLLNKADKTDIIKPDWNTLENRPFGEGIDWFIFAEEQTITLNYSNGATWIESADTGGRYINRGDNYVIVFDGDEYEGIVWEDGDACYRLDFTTKDGIYVTVSDGYSIWADTNELDGEHTVEIRIGNLIITTLPDKFLPREFVSTIKGIDNIITSKAPVKSVNNKSGNVILNYQDVQAVPLTRKINNKPLNTDVSLNAKDVNALTNCDAVGTGYFVMNESDNYMSEQVTGYNSFVVGTGNVASHRSMSVIGEYNADGRMCEEIISEPKTQKISKQNYLHEVFGVRFIKDSPINRNGGNILYFFKADGTSSGGIVPKAGMKYTHTSSLTSNYYTEIISVDDEDDTYWYVTERTHSGEYVPDTRQKYIHIVGNGTSDTERSNAHTLDWEGNAWFAGSVEGTALILLSPNGTRFNITVGDDGVLSATKMAE